MNVGIFESDGKLFADFSTTARNFTEFKKNCESEGEKAIDFVKLNVGDRGDRMLWEALRILGDYTDGSGSQGLRYLLENLFLQMYRSGVKADKAGKQ